MSESETKVRVCQACGEDCSGQPRIKDSKGRYIHKTCAERILKESKSKKSRPASTAAAAPVAVAAAPVESRPLAMDSFLDDSLKLVAQTCPNCNNSMPEGTQLCVRCGYNFETGKTHKTVASVEKAPKGERSTSDGGGFFTPPVVATAYAVLMIGTGFLMAEKPAFLLIGLIAVLVYLVMILATIVVSFMDSVLRGLAVMFVPFYMFYYLLGLCENQWVKWLTLTSMGVWFTIAYGFALGGIVDPAVLDAP